MKIRIKKTNRLVPVSRWILQLGNFRYTNTEAMWLIGSMENPKIDDISRVPIEPKIENMEWVGWTTGHTPRAEGTFDNITWHTPYKPLGFWQNIKYHIIWWKK